MLRLARCDGDAWAEFVTVYEQAIFRYCRARGLQDADAQDATQDVLIAVYKRIESWDQEKSKGSLRAWLFCVARNVAIDEVRRRQRRPLTGDAFAGGEMQQIPEPNKREGDAFLIEYRRALFQWAAEHVRPEVRQSTWQAFWLTAVDERTPEQVADETGLSIGAVYTAKCRVVARLKQKITEADSDNKLPIDLLCDDANDDFFSKG